MVRERRGAPVSSVWCVTRGRLGLVSPRGPGRVAVRAASPWRVGCRPGTRTRRARAAGCAPACPVGLVRLPRQGPAGHLHRVGSSARACPPWAPVGQGACRASGAASPREGAVQGAAGRAVVLAGRWGCARRVCRARAPVTVRASRVQEVATGRAWGAGRAPARRGRTRACRRPPRAFARASLRLLAAPEAER